MIDNNDEINVHTCSTVGLYYTLKFLSGLYYNFHNCYILWDSSKIKVDIATLEAENAYEHSFFLIYLMHPQKLLPQFYLRYGNYNNTEIMYPIKGNVIAYQC